MGTSKFRRRTIVFVLMLVGMLTSGTMEVSAKTPQGVLKQAIHWSISADWLDPSTNSALVPAQICTYLFHDALVKPMPNQTFFPSLAESWTISPDAKTFEFKIRQGVKFHNGDPLTAEDVVFTFWRYKGPQAKLIHNKTEKVEAVNPHLVRFTFKTPFPDFLEYHMPAATTIGWIVPKKYVEKVGDAGYKKNPVGCGPYKLVEFSTGVKMVAEAFDEYWRKVPNVKRLEFLIVREPATRLAMTRRGETDIAVFMTGIFYEDAKKDKNLRVFMPRSPTRWLVYLTDQWNPKSPWSNPKVRKAASLAIDRKTLADIYMPGCGPIGSLALPNDANGIEFPADPYDPQQAKKLLAEAGYPKGFHGGKFFPYQGGYWEYGEQVANYWKAIGITMDTVLLDRPAWFANRQGGKMKGAVFIDNSQAATIGGRLVYLFGGTSYGNYPDIEEVWNQYNNAVDPKIRKERIARIQRMMHEKTMFIFLTDTNTPAAVGPKLKDNAWRIDPFIWFTSPFEDIEINP